MISDGIVRKSQPTVSTKTSLPQVFQDLNSQCNISTLDSRADRNERRVGFGVCSETFVPSSRRFLLIDCDLDARKKNCPAPRILPRCLALALAMRFVGLADTDTAQRTALRSTQRKGHRFLASHDAISRFLILSRSQTCCCPSQLTFYHSIPFPWSLLSTSL